MRDAEKPKITIIKNMKKQYTRVSWIPDFNQFDLCKYTSDIISLYTRYIVDTAMLSKINVFLNDVEIPVKSLKDYCNLYNVNKDENLYIKHENSEVFLTTSTGNFEFISFINGVYTRLGGVHVDSWSEALFRPIVDKFNGTTTKDTKKKTVNINKININDVKQFFKIFVVSYADKPEFNGQEKEKMESPKLNVEVKKTHITCINKWSIIENIENIIKAKEFSVLKKNEKKKGRVVIENYDPANNTNTKKSSECTLIVCEGL
jgi:DNA topoisomerase-2